MYDNPFLFSIMLMLYASIAMFVVVIFCKFFGRNESSEDEQLTPVEELDLGGKLATVEEYFAGWSDSNKKLSEELRQEELRKEESLGRDTG